MQLKQTRIGHQLLHILHSSREEEHHFAITFFTLQSKVIKQSEKSNININIIDVSDDGGALRLMYVL
jgi:hypothetical protein